MANSMSNKRFRIITIIFSIAIPLIVAILMKVKIEGYNFSFLPPIYASMNALTAVLLVIALVAIKKKNVALHERTIKICFMLSLLFLAMYVLYHITSHSTVYGDLDGDGALSEMEKLQVSSLGRTIYLIVLVTHILLSAIVVPLVMFSFMYAREKNFEKHKKWTRFTWPIWFYVAVSGVAIFLMIQPYFHN